MILQRATIIATLLLLLACRPQAGEAVKLSGSTMGTGYQVVVPGLTEADQIQVLRDEISTTLTRVSALMSTWDPDSEISRFNASASTDWFEVSGETLEVLSAAQAISQSSGGAFDITIGPLVDLWGFGPVAPQQGVPTAQALAAAQQRVGYQKLQLRAQPPAIRKENPKLHVDLSAIAKGYGVDRLAEVLQRRGHEDYLVEIGGEMRVSGHNEHGHAWRIAIERPTRDQRSVHRVIGVKKAGIATSGDYRNFLEIDGQHYAHSIDPRTGHPIPWTGGSSVTVLAQSAMRADALATALMVLGPEAAMAYAEQSHLAVLLLVREQGQLKEIRSRAFDDCFKSLGAAEGCQIASQVTSTRADELARP